MYCDGRRMGSNALSKKYKKEDRNFSFVAAFSLHQKKYKAEAKGVVAVYLFCTTPEGGHEVWGPRCSELSLWESHGRLLRPPG